MDEALILCRALHYSAAIMLFGASVFQETSPPTDLARFIAPPMRRLAALAIVIIFLTTIAWLMLESGEMGGGWVDASSPNTVSTVLFETEFGRVWQWRLGFVAILLGLLMSRRYGNWRVIAFWSALVLASLGFVGHGAMQTGVEGLLHRSSHSLHLLAAGLWLGALLPLLACLRVLRHATLGEDVEIALRRFSYLGYVAVATVLITGVANTWFVFEVWPIGLWSSYRALLVAKIGLVAAMLGLAIVNRFVLTPRLRTSVEAPRQLRVNMIAEVVLGFSAIALVSAFGTFAPE